MTKESRMTQVARRMEVWRAIGHSASGFRDASPTAFGSSISSFGILGLAAILLAGCSPNPSNQFQGYIEGEYVYVASPLSGTLEKLGVARGDRVRSGQWLFQLERRSEADAARQAGNNLAQAKANLALSQAEYARREQLRSDQGVISAEELDQARAQRDADQAQVEAQIAALAKANWSFEQKEQFAPTNAYVQDTLYRVGEWVATGSPVVQLLPPANLKVRFFVPEKVLPKIKPGQGVQVIFDGGKRDYSATVNYLSTQAEFTPPVIYSQENRAKLVYMIEAKFSPADAANLRPGQPVDVRLPVE
ncbi:MAG TPA: efflux RND transporter periplasmic adaptor subunit [Candidatus Sulfopaludibacter sp.]|nr:efflux RND transporter periplasmic adaptor subunit [Candidatus Sulfopaludibacter sp.]